MKGGVIALAGLDDQGRQGGCLNPRPEGWWLGGWQKAGFGRNHLQEEAMEWSILFAFVFSDL